MVGKLGARRLAFEAAALSVADFEALREKLPTVELRASADRVEALRAIKDEDEIAAIREAIDFAERAFAMLRAGLRRGETEKDVADALEGYLRRCGATAASFPPIVAVGVAVGACRTPGRRPRRGSATPTSSWSTGGRPAGPTKVT